MRSKRSLVAAIVAFLPLAGHGGDESDAFTKDDKYTAQTALADMHEAVTKYYYPNEKIGKAFDDRCDEAKRALENVHSNGEAFGVIADALASPDPRILFLPPARHVRVDYSWQWKLIGNAAYVTQVDRVGDARKQGLQVGDKVLSFEGLAINRENYLDIDYAFRGLAPRPGLRVLVESPGKEPRWLAIAATPRAQRKLRYGLGGASVALSESDKRHRDEFRDLKQHLHRVGPVAVWRVIELRDDIPAVVRGLKEIRSASALVLDLRGLEVLGREPALELLDGLFAEKFTAGTLRHVALRSRGVDDETLRFGGTDAFRGTILVLVDSETSRYAEICARILQLKQRAVVLGDYTTGRMYQTTLVTRGQGASFGFSAEGVLIPTGEILLPDGTSLAGKRVAPDLLLLPTAADLAGNRDVVLAKALKMLKQPLSPEEAWKLVRLPSEDDDE